MKFSIAKDFSISPAGLSFTTGRHSAEHLRERLETLISNLGKGELLEINFNGTLGFSSSFLEVAFRGLGYAPLILISDDTSLTREVKQYMDEPVCVPGRVAEHLRSADAYLSEVELLKAGGISHADGLHKALVEVIAYLAERDDVKGFKPTVLTRKGPTQKQLQDLWRACQEWRDKYQPSCAESLVQADRCSINAYELTTAAMEIVGYWKDPKDD